MLHTVYAQLVAVFAPLSLLSIGGGQSIIADINKQVVQVHAWATQAQFVDMFAISRAAPGPGSLLVTLIGWQVSGFLGAVVASLALYVPSSVLAYAANRAWDRHHGHAWHGAVERGLAPIATGLILSSAFTILRGSSGALSLWAIAFLSTSIFMLRPKLNPLLVLFAAGVAQVVFHAWS